MDKLVLMVEVWMTLVIIFGSEKVSDAEACWISYEKIGCFEDHGSRPFPQLLLNKRKIINWENWNEFLETLVCECANVTAAAGYTYFGIQFFGECWTGENPDVAYDSGGKSNSCFGQNFLPCDASFSSCAGEENVNYVYRINLGQSSPACEDIDPGKCQEFRLFCNVYPNIKSQCPLTCNSCETTRNLQ
ncbi:unnamed protein product [Porites lobata]|uniref:ShKT domain-containing protein n=1 Tax=Porites lobata TaxID=104759 RepID=A0ABN8RGY1_9CNID|nr:unnamed protein product [Porites lobata]